MSATVKNLRQAQAKEIEELRSKSSLIRHNSVSDRAPQLNRNNMSRSLTQIQSVQHPTNNSTSKQMFSFGIGDRFK